MKPAGRRCSKSAQAKLLTPVGLRSLSPDHKDYKPKYDGDLRARDAAYHQGTVWAWLIGPFIDAWLKVHPDDTRSAGKFLDGFVAASARSLHRLHQRDLRCRAAVHTARMHRTSLERGGGVAVLDQVPSALARGAYPRKPSFCDPKFAKFGNTVASALSGIPNQEHSVAPY